MNTRTKLRTTAGATLLAFLLLMTTVFIAARPTEASPATDPPDQVLEWNQIFIDTLIATNTANSSSQRLGAIVQSAVFDAYNGIERRYTPIYVNTEAPRGASRRAAVIAAAYTTLAGLFPSRQTQLYANYLASLDALSDDGGDGGKSRERGIAWGTFVAQQVLAWRSADGFSVSQPAFIGGTTVGQWRPTITQNATCTSMSAQPLAFTSMFVLQSNELFRPPPPRGLNDGSYVSDLAAVKSLGAISGSTRTSEQTALAPFWEGNASTHWNQAANQLARANGLSMSENSRLFAVLNVAMADTAFTVWSAKRYYGADSGSVTWRPFTAIREGSIDSDPTWRPLVNTPCHPEYPAGHPAQNGAASTILLNKFGDGSGSFVLTTGSASFTYGSIMQAREDGNNARIWGGMHYPSTVTISDALGSSIGLYVDQTAMQRLNGADNLE
ncbi:MAG: vanadium-dependent haloperoxidase [Pyrinomonadaceae bacterium]